MRLPIPKAVERRLKPLMDRGEVFLREWEWTWTTATLAGLAISFFALTVLAVVPSWFLYTAENNWGWAENRLLETIRDIIATGWLGFWATFFVVTFYMLQKIRRRVRGEKQAERYTGGYR